MGMNKKVIGLFKDELGRTIMNEFCALRAKTYSCSTDDDSEKKARGINRYVIKRSLMFKNYKDSLSNHKTVLKSQKIFKSDHHDVYAEEVNKIALSSTGNKKLQTFDTVTTYPYETNTFKVCESKMSSKYK